MLSEMESSCKGPLSPACWSRTRTQVFLANRPTLPLQLEE